MDTAIIAAIIGGLLAIVAAFIGVLVGTEQLIFTDLFRWRRQLRAGFIIMVNGGSGVGKTSVAWALARRLNIPLVLGTDIVREVIRYGLPDDPENQASLLLTSSFLAHHRLGRELPEAGGDRVVEAFSLQSKQLVGPIVGIINRVRTKRDPIIIEGVNMLATYLFEEIPNDPKNAVFFINLYLDSPECHVDRLRLRGTAAHEFPELTDRYIREIDAIREIDEFLKQDTKGALASAPMAHESIMSIENSGRLSHTVNLIEKAVRRKLKLVLKG